LKTENKLSELSPEFVLKRIRIHAPGNVTASPGANPAESL
jgi:hypothetical protein